MPNRILDASPRLRARIAGVLFLLTIVAGIYAEMFVSDQLVVGGNPAATAANILAHRGLFQISFAVYMIEMACQIAMTVLLYTLLRPVSASLALIAMVIGLTGCIIKALGRLFYVAPLLVLGGGGAHYLDAFSTPQLQALALLSLKLNSQGAGIALIFFGIESPLEGYLMFRSNFLPRILGVLGMIGGVGWLTWLYPPFASRVFPFVALLALVASVVQIVWFIAFGVNEQRWKEQAGWVEPART